MSSRILFATLVVLLLFGAYRQIHAHRSAMPSIVVASELRAASRPEAAGSFPAEWIDGLECEEEERFQAHPYNEDLYIIRQSKCAIFEGPFMYLIFGDERVLLMDTGANPKEDVWGTVDRVIQGWLAARGQSSIRLTVAHTHSHGDHFAGDGQFAGKPYVDEVVGLALADVKEFWGFADWPNDTPTIDLGNRVLDVLATPGHQGASVTLYDRRTHLLLTGDIVYPGHLFVFSPPAWPEFVDSLRRLARFASAHPVEWVVGCHIETSDMPYRPYKYATQGHADEHVLQFPPAELVEIYEAAVSMGETPQCQAFDEFVIHPVYLCGIFWNG